MDGCEEIAGEFVVASGYAPEILEPTEAPLDDVSAFVGAFVEMMQGDAVGFVGNDGPCTTFEDQGAESVAIIAFVGKERVHRWRERQDIWCRGDVGVLAGREMQGVWPTKRIAQSMDFRGASAAGATDCLRAFPPFPPLAERCALIEVESSDRVTESLPLLASASKIACQRPRLAQRLKRL